MKEVFRFMFRQVAPHRKEVMRMSLLAVFAGLLDIGIPLLLSHGIDSAKLHSPVPFIPDSWAVGSFAVVAGWLLGWYLVRNIASNTRLRIERDAEVLGFETSVSYFRDAIGALLRKPLSFHSSRSNAKIAQGISQLRNDVEIFVMGTLFGFLPSMLTLLGSFLAIAWIEYRVAILLGLTIAAYAWYARRSVPGLIALREGFQEEFQEFTSLAFDALTNVLLVKTSSAEPAVMADLQRRQENLQKVVKRESDETHRTQRNFGTIVRLGTALATVVAVAFYRIDRVTAGDLSAIVAYSSTLFAYVQQFRPLISRMIRANSHMATQRDIDSVPDEPYGIGEQKELLGEIEFRNVSFRYQSDVPVLDDVSFHIASGERIGVVGLTGAGKSTVSQLICRLIEPTGGTVLFDGVPATAIELSSVRKQIAMVSQSPEMFHSSVHRNIAIGDPVGTTREDVRVAGRQAQLDPFISKLPQGYDTIVGDDGVRLSGGQRQRAGLARAFLGGPRPILIFDEPTAQQDAITELGIQETLEGLPSNTTVIMIAHRLRTLHNMDRIMVLHKGRIVDQGPHADLVKRGGLYLDLLKAQGMYSDETGSPGLH